ncbi:MAG TPA: SGNH hydrolase domain-containing protein [Solirubrobacteraceae bacterium]|jgi:hypothetical protein
MRRLVALLAVITAALTALAGPAPAGARDQIAMASTAPTAHDDPAEGGTRLDLLGVRFGQTLSSDMDLVIRTYGPWRPGDVGPADGHLLCIWLRTDGAPAPDGRLCVLADAQAKSGLALHFTTLDPAGDAIGVRDVPATIGRPRPTTVDATFDPAVLRLTPGLYHWQARSLDGGVEDYLPNSGEVPLRIVAASAPGTQHRCFGAASRDPRHPCVNALLRRLVVPTPDDAVIAVNSPCSPIEITGLLRPCEFGVPAPQATRTVALVGDSHAAHWRAALEVAAQTRHWRGISITRSGCPLSRAPARIVPASRQAGCALWNEQVPRWFAQHPEVHTAIVVAHFAAQVQVAPGADPYETKIAGFLAAWKALPRSVTRIVVIRDTPLIGFAAQDCIRTALAHHDDVGRTCALPRDAVLGRDAAVAAARRLNSARVRIVDLTHFLCSAKQCFPVVGGALVYKDDQHLTDVFATTLGPYLLRALDAVS